MFWGEPRLGRPQKAAKAAPVGFPAAEKKSGDTFALYTPPQADLNKLVLPLIFNNPQPKNIFRTLNDRSPYHCTAA
jgi:hypothetical protein